MRYTVGLPVLALLLASHLEAAPDHLVKPVKVTLKLVTQRCVEPEDSEPTCVDLLKQEGPGVDGRKPSDPRVESETVHNISIVLAPGEISAMKSCGEDASIELGVVIKERQAHAVSIELEWTYTVPDGGDHTGEFSTWFPLDPEDRIVNHVIRSDAVDGERVVLAESLYLSAMLLD